METYKVKVNIELKKTTFCEQIFFRKKSNKTFYEIWMNVSESFVAKYSEQINYSIN